MFYSYMAVYEDVPVWLSLWLRIHLCGKLYSSPVVVMMRCHDTIVHRNVEVVCLEVNERC